MLNSFFIAEHCSRYFGTQKDEIQAMTLSSDNLTGSDQYHSGNNKGQENKVKYEVLNYAPDTHLFSKPSKEHLTSGTPLDIEHTGLNKTDKKYLFSNGLQCSRAGNNQDKYINILKSK